MGLCKKAIIGIIKVYQRRISPLKKPSCRFYPTCSQYAIDAVTKFGVLRGSIKAIIRISTINAMPIDSHFKKRSS